MCGAALLEIVGPIFFENNLDSNKYSILLETELPVLLENFPLRLRLDTPISNKMNIHHIHQELPMQY